MGEKRTNEKTRYPDIHLRNFWPIGWVGHTDSGGDDVAREFLADLVYLSKQENTEVVIESHFQISTNFQRLVKKTSELWNRNGLANQQRKYGYLHMADVEDASERIWYTSENLRPPLDINFYAFLSHDLDSFNGRNIYLPIWVTRLGKSVAEAVLTQERMKKERKDSTIPKKFASAVISNPEPARMEFIRQLSKIGEVEVFGKIGKPITSKHETISEFRYNICFENDLYPGYVTEKPFEAWEAGTIPVWRGIDQLGTINKDSLINVSELGFSESLKKIRMLESDQKSYIKMRNSPILQNEINLNLIVEKLRKLQIESMSKVR